MKHLQAPPIATWLLERVLPATDREAVIGDLIEEYALRARSTPPSIAGRWYWGQVYRSIPQVLRCAIRRGRWLGAFGVAFVAYIAAGLLESAGFSLMSRLLGSDARPPGVLDVFIGLATLALGGYFAAWVRPGAAGALAGIVVVAVPILMVTTSESAPLWYGLTFLVVGPLAAVAGGALLTIARSRSTERAT